MDSGDFRTRDWRFRFFLEDLFFRRRAALLFSFSLMDDILGSLLDGREKTLLAESRARCVTREDAQFAFIVFTERTRDAADVYPDPEGEAVDGPTELTSNLNRSTK